MLQQRQSVQHWLLALQRQLVQGRRPMKGPLQFTAVVGLFSGLLVLMCTIAMQVWSTCAKKQKWKLLDRSAKSSSLILLTLACLLHASVHGQGSAGQGGGGGSRDSPFADDFARESPSAPISANSPESPFGMARVAFRSSRGGLFAHHWVEVQTSKGSFTLGFGPAMIPFIDRGQITVEDRYGHIEWRYLLHPFSLHWNFARAPGIGRNIARVAYLPISKADALVENQRHRHPILPYIPFFHDCRTYVCTVQASIQGKSRLPCYLLLKGYW